MWFSTSALKTVSVFPTGVHTYSFPSVAAYHSDTIYTWLFSLLLNTEGHWGFFEIFHAGSLCQPTWVGSVKQHPMSSHQPSRTSCAVTCTQITGKTSSCSICCHFLPLTATICYFQGQSISQSISHFHSCWKLQTFPGKGSHGMVLNCTGQFHSFLHCSVFTSDSLPWISRLKWG